VILLRGEQATWRTVDESVKVEAFSTTSDLGERLERLAHERFDAVFHAAAVSDFRFGKVWRRSEGGSLVEVTSGKYSTREGPLLAELLSTPKLIAGLRNWFPRALLVGWKYEVDGDRASVLELSQKQINECRTDCCVANGPAYGLGFGLVKSEGAPVHCRSTEALFDALDAVLGRDPV
jgi:phosphopantothenoylcysteine decarboxylase/phosphopantothenate--cysteine ligase